MYRIMTCLLRVGYGVWDFFRKGWPMTINLTWRGTSINHQPRYIIMKYQSTNKETNYLLLKTSNCIVFPLLNWSYFNSPKFHSNIFWKFLRPPLILSFVSYLFPVSNFNFSERFKWLDSEHQFVLCWMQTFRTTVNCRGLRNSCSHKDKNIRKYNNFFILSCNFNVSSLISNLILSFAWKVC